MGIEINVATAVLSVIVAIITLIGVPLAWYYGGRQKQSGDTIKSMHEVYSGFIVDYKDKMKEALLEISTVKAHYKEIQIQFNEMYIQYTKEVEVSQNWEKLHRELKEKYDSLQTQHNVLQTQHETLKKDHEKLKTDFKKYTKDTTTQ